VAAEEARGGGAEPCSQVEEDTGPDPRRHGDRGGEQPVGKLERSRDDRDRHAKAGNVAPEDDGHDSPALEPSSGGLEPFWIEVKSPCQWMFDEAWTPALRHVIEIRGAGDDNGNDPEPGGDQQPAEPFSRLPR